MHTLSCDTPGWDFHLHKLLLGQNEVDLINFNYDTVRKLCEFFARNNRMLLVIDYGSKTAQFRKTN
jgi:hypothetical protein